MTPVTRVDTARWRWDDGDWMRARGSRHAGDMPLAFYRLDADAWHHSRFAFELDWSRLVRVLVPYVADLGFTHVSLDSALLEQPEAIVCRFVDICHIAGVGVVVESPADWPEAKVDQACQRYHLDGIEAREASGAPRCCRLFIDDSCDRTVTLDHRRRWQAGYPAYLKASPNERSLAHRDWISALTPQNDGRSLLDILPQAGVGESWQAALHGNAWQRFATLRALLATMWALPGDKWLSMGIELGQPLVATDDEPIRWGLQFETPHAGMMRLVADLNRLYVNEPALQVSDDERQGFGWLVDNDRDNSVAIFRRSTQTGRSTLICICNFQPHVHYHYRLGVPAAGRWREILNTDSEFYGGSNIGNGFHATTTAVASHDCPQSLTLIVPPLAVLFFRHETGYEGGQ